MVKLHTHTHILIGKVFVELRRGGALVEVHDVMGINHGAGAPLWVAANLRNVHRAWTESATL